MWNEASNDDYYNDEDIAEDRHRKEAFDRAWRDYEETGGWDGPEPEDEPEPPPPCTCFKRDLEECECPRPPDWMPF